jgi:predicted NUDIX family NTP pyrophosphohydrolase
MPKRSAGLLPFRRLSDGDVEVFIVHPGGPLWADKDEHAWSVAKGEYESGEDPRRVAHREFLEEIGVEAPSGRTHDLGEVRQASGKRVQVWAIEAPAFTVAVVESNEFELEWPPRSSAMQRFPEVDRAEWVSIAAARRKLVKGQVEFLARLMSALGSARESEADGDREG